MAPRNRNKPKTPLSEWRKNLGLNQRTAAAHLQVSTGYYCKLERRKMFPYRLLAKSISRKTGIPVEVVLGIA